MTASARKRAPYGARATPQVVALEPAPTPATEPAPANIESAGLTWFNDLYERAYGQLWAYALRMGGDASIADDVTQESFVRVLQAPRRVRDRGPLDPYLYRVATNLLRDHWRRRHRDTRIERAIVETRDPARNPYRRDDDHRQGSELERAHELERTFARLKPRERALLWLAHVDGYSHREIATILQLRPLSVRVLLSRARKQLAALLDE
jgi:RNA polymerase sigma-70 factor (ECF subfamily)